MTRRTAAKLLSAFGPLSLLRAQAPRVGSIYWYTKTGSGNITITVQAPTTGGRIVQLLEAYVYGTSAVTVEQFRNGTAATTTDDSSAIAKLNPDVTDTPKLKVFQTSNVNNTAAQVLPVVEALAGVGTVLDLGDCQIAGSGTSKNYTFKLTTSGTYRISVKWREYDI